MKLCPFCAEEIQDAAIRCKHCRSDLAAVQAPARAGAALSPRASRGARILLGCALVAAVLAASLPVLAGPLLRQLRADRCEPANWVEWHLAMRKQCLKPSYVCEHMTTRKMLDDPDIARLFEGEGAGGYWQLGELVGRMRHTYGCAPERAPAVDDEAVPAPAFPMSQDAPRTL